MYSYLQVEVAILASSAALTVTVAVISRMTRIEARMIWSHLHYNKWHTPRLRLFPLFRLAVHLSRTYSVLCAYSILSKKKILFYLSKNMVNVFSQSIIPYSL